MAGVKRETKKDDEFRQARNALYTFFYFCNKPVSTTELCLQFKNYPKKTLTTALSSLVEKKKIFEKLANSKSKMYCLTQETEYTIDDADYTPEMGEKYRVDEDDDDVICYLRWKNAAVNGELEALKAEARELDRLLDGYGNELPPEVLKAEILQFQETLKSNEKAVIREYVDEEKFEAAVKELNLLAKELAKRKKVYNDVVGGLADGMDMKKSELLLDVGIEENEGY